MPPVPISSSTLTADPNQKLTKKQLKSLAFKAAKAKQEQKDSNPGNERIESESAKEASTSELQLSDQEKKEKVEKKKSKSKKKEKERNKGDRLIPDGGDLPEMDQDPENDQPSTTTATSTPVKIVVGESKNEAKRKAKAEKKEKKKEEGSGKRKRDQIEGERDADAEGENGEKASKKIIGEDGKVLEKKADTKEKGKGKGKAGEMEKKKLILFVGNMSFTTTSLQLASHFSSTGETPTVRLLTKKVDAQTLSAPLSASKLKSIARGKAADPRKKEVSKGCAFLEFKKTDSLQKALRFHHTMFEGRMINVELTAGGGGAGGERKEKIRKKNEVLDEERAKLHTKYIGPANEAQKLLPKKEPPRKKVDEFGVGEAQWGPRGATSETTNGEKKGPTGKQRRDARFSATGVNSVRLGN